MDIEIKVPDLLKKPMIEFYQYQLSEVETKAQELNKQAAAIRAILTKLEGLPAIEYNLVPHIKINVEASVNGNGNGYHKDWTWGQKISYLIKKAGRPLSTGEIADLIVSNEYEPELRTRREKVVGSLSSVLTSEKGQKSYKLQRGALGQRVYDLIEK